MPRFSTRMQAVARVLFTMCEKVRSNGRECERKGGPNGPSFCLHPLSEGGPGGRARPIDRPRPLCGRFARKVYKPPGPIGDGRRCGRAAAAGRAAKHLDALHQTKARCFAGASDKVRCRNLATWVCALSGSNGQNGAVPCGDRCDMTNVPAPWRAGRVPAAPASPPCPGYSRAHSRRR